MNDVLISKAQSIQRCVARAREEFHLAGDGFDTDYTRQDAAMLNVTRACEQAIDLANHVVKQGKLGVPTDSAESFSLLARGGIIPEELSRRLQKMIGFRNTAIHEYQGLNIAIVRAVITGNTGDLLEFSRLMLQRG